MISLLHFHTTNTGTIPPQFDDLSTRDIRFSLHWDKADHSDVVLSLSSVCLSVCLSVTLLRPTQTVELFGNIFDGLI